MKLTIIQTGEVAEPLRADFSSYPSMFKDMFDSAGAEFSYQTIALINGAQLPDPSVLEGIIITGSAFGVYDPEPWMEPLRNFIRAAYTHNIPMLGVCFGHQIIADAMGGEVRKSEKGWSLGPHLYRATKVPRFMQTTTETVSLLAMHQDQVIAPPPAASVFLASDFTPNAGLAYANGSTFSVQPHPEFTPAYLRALLNFRADKFPDPMRSVALGRLEEDFDSIKMASQLAQKFAALRPGVEAAQ